MIKFNHNLDENGQNYLEVEAEVSQDISAWPSETYLDVCAVTLNGCMSIKLDEIPAELKVEIIETWIQTQ